ncbi:MAG: hypothetical protein ACP5G0_12900, partial [Desulfomonilia bacterium]
RQQVKKGECTRSEFWQFILNGLRGKRYDYMGGIVVRVKGEKKGRMTTLIRRSAASTGELFYNMAQATGTPFAALSRMVLDGHVLPSCRKGVFSTEAWVDVHTFYRYMERYGAKESHFVEPICEEKNT